MSRRRRTPVLLALGGLLVSGTVALAPPSGAAPPESVAASTSAGAPQSGRMLSGKQVQGRSYATPPSPTPEQARYLSDEDSNGAGPRGTMTTAAPAAPTGPGIGAPAEAPNDLQLYRNSRLSAGGQRSGVDEPSTVTSGKDGFATGNWYAAYTHTGKNAAPTWSYLDPFSIFGSGFCCDQLTAYDPGHDRYFWLGQYNNHLVIANSRGSDLTNWCYYNWYPSSFGLPSGASFDYNHLSVSTRFLYFSTNVYGASGGSLVARIPLQEQSTCSSLNYGWYYRTTEFSPAFTQNGGDYMYWGTNWTSNLSLGSTFRVLRWGDADSGATVYDRNIAAFSFMSFNTGNCASADRAVLNWCQRTDSRMAGTGYVAIAGKSGADSVVGWAFNAKQDGGHAFPYSRRVYFRASDLTYLGSSELWSSSFAILYPAMASDSRGHVGMAFEWGGGTGTTRYYPGAGIMLDDDLSPGQPWATSLYLGGSGNACLNSDGLRRWGDYVDVHPTYPSSLGFAASGFALTANAGSCSSAASVAVSNVVFGRNRDLLAWQRWS